MKLFYCPLCQDIRKMKLVKLVKYQLDPEDHCCSCRESWGYYIDELNAEYGGKAVPLGVSDSDFVEAMRRQKRSGDRTVGMGRRFAAFIIPDKCKTCKRIED